MSKRKLTKQQKTRISARHDARRERADSNNNPADKHLGPEQEGLVISHLGKAILVEAGDGSIYRCTIRQNLGHIVCGDNVIWQATEPESGVIIAIRERRSVLTRPDFRRKPKPVVANIDQIIIVAAPEPEISEYLIDRYLVILASTGLSGIILINKTDLLSATELQELQARLRLYQEIGYPVVFASVKQEHGLDDLVTQLRDRRSILVGQSGVGKSSLVKKLLPDLEIRIGALNEASQGKHTTTTAVLYHLPFGGDLVDSPGVRDFGIWDVDSERIIQGFREFHPFLGQCRFHNCQHDSEPGCAIKAAVDEGKIDARRLQSYHRMLKDIAGENA